MIEIAVCDDDVNDLNNMVNILCEIFKNQKSIASGLQDGISREDKNQETILNLGI